MTLAAATIEVRGANEHNLKNIDVTIDRGASRSWGFVLCNADGR